jgi:hypothetical protein
MKNKIRLARIGLLGLITIAVFGTLGYVVNEKLRTAGPIFFVVAFGLSYGIFFWLTKSAKEGKIKWLIHE